MNEQDRIFDAAMRATWREAAARISPATRLQLRAPRTRETPQWPAWLGWAGGAGMVAAALALALALPMRSPTATQPAGETLATQAGGGEDTGALAQDPDFYAWLGEADARVLAMETSR